MPQAMVLNRQTTIRSKPMAHPLDAFSLNGETALVTGGGSGLGLGIAKCFVQAGARVILVGRRTDVLERAVAGLGAAADFEKHDITQVGLAGELLERITQKH